MTVQRRRLSDERTNEGWWMVGRGRGGGEVGWGPNSASGIASGGPRAWRWPLVSSPSGSWKVRVHRSSHFRRTGGYAGAPD